MQLLTLSKKILAISLLSSTVYANEIGDITEHKGSGGITREGESFTTELGLGIQQMDAIETAKGRIKLTFLDDTVLRLVEHTEVVLTKYYFDPDNKKNNSLSMKFVSGTARFATGKLGLVPKENITLTTPTATIAVRGTSFTTTVDELGRSLVVLLPETECTIDGDCSPSGAITVTNEGGVVTLTEAYQATMVSSYDQIPTQPVVLQNLTMNMIDNMFIVSPPEQITEAVNEEQGRNSGDNSTSLLDFTELDQDLLKEDWDGEDLEYTELDMDLLDVDFLQDVLVAIEEVNILKRSTQSAQSGSGEFDIQGTILGFDKNTQYSTIVDTGSGQIWFYREVNGIISVRVPIDGSTTLRSENEGKENLITVGDGQSVVIIINQSG
tara:strand:+ start:15435 stop:16580 length:1146 start_codon:yes stop_codon:yes gene_type:complete